MGKSPPTAGGMRNSSRLEAGSGALSSARAWSSPVSVVTRLIQYPKPGRAPTSSAITAGQAALTGSMGSKWPIPSRTTSCGRTRREVRLRELQRHERVVGTVDDRHRDGGPGQGRGIQVGAVDGGPAEERAHCPVVEAEPIRHGEVGHGGEGEHRARVGAGRLAGEQCEVTAGGVAHDDNGPRDDAASHPPAPRERRRRCRRGAPGAAGTRRERWGVRLRRALPPSAAGAPGRTRGARSPHG